MRKFFSMALISFMIVLSCGLTAVAESDDNIIDVIPELSTADVITAAINYDPLTHTYTIAGSFDREKRGNITVGLRIFNERNELVQTAITTANRDEKGRVVFAFEPVVFFVDAESGKYSFELSSFLGNKTIISEFLNIGDGLELMLKLDGLSGEAYKQVIAEECSSVGADVEVFKNLSSESKAVVVSRLSAIKSGLTADTINDPDCETKVSTAINNFLTNYNYHTAIAVFNDCKTASDVDEWIKKYAVMYGLKLNDSETSYDESDLWKYYDNSNVSQKVNSLLVQYNDVEEMEEIKALVIEKILTVQLDISHVSAVDSFLGEFNSAFSIDLKDYNKLSDKSSVRKKIVDTGLYTYAEVKNKFYELVEQREKEEKDSGKKGSSGGSGGSGSSGGGFGMAASGVTESVITDTQKTKLPFTDIDDAKWAKSYIETLYSKGIINGKSATQFAPNDKITRAEIVKIVTEAFGLVKKTGKTFGDVSSDDWFYEYVTAAADNGVVAGDENGNFNPDAPVTRQDIAVILYRVTKAEWNNTNADFTDFNEISDYAKYAVSYFSAKKVINGYPDGSFNPYGFATRAEASKIIASVID